MYYSPCMYVFPPVALMPPNVNPSAYINQGFIRANNFLQLKDYGKLPFVINIEEASIQNRNFRTAIWTGDKLQVTVMSIPVDGDIGLEVHPDTDQFLRIEQGQGVIQMGERKENLSFQRAVHDDDAIMVPKGTWHNLINTGNIPLKLYTIYAPPEHPFGTVHRTKEEAMAEHRA